MSGLQPSPFAQKFLSRLRACGLPQEDPRVEQILAICRVFLAVVALIAARVHIVTGTPYPAATTILLTLYLLWGLALLLRLRWKPVCSAQFVFWLQIVDIGLPVLLCLFTDPTNGVFFIMFLFGLLAAAFRWDLIGTLSTATVVSILLGLQVLAVRFGPHWLASAVHTSPSSSRLLLRCSFLLLTGFLAGVLAETEKELRSEIMVINRLLSMARIGNRFDESLHAVLSELSHLYGSQNVYQVVHQTTGQLFRWNLTPGVEPGVIRIEIPPGRQHQELMRDYPHTFFARLDGTDPQRCRIWALDEEGRKVSPSTLKHLAMPVEGAKTLLAVTLDLGREWSGRIVVIDAKLGPNPDRELHFAQNIMLQLAPALYSVYLFRRLRSRVGAMERARVARELHDTAIQSLISIEMQIDVLRRQSNHDGWMGAELERVQHLLRDEVLNLRELMQTMRPVEIGPNQFLDFIAQLVERFGRDTGISARFVSELQEATLPTTIRRELARVVQEGLVNIRKHSGAHSVLVRFGAQNGLWRLVIDDDGRGFPFTGRFTLAELDDLHFGPAVIKERVHTVGGDMVIESTPGHGSRLEISVPQKGYGFYG